MMNFGFVTCVELGMACMRQIYRSGGRLQLAITLEDDFAPNKSGRTSLDAFCSERSIELLKVRSINERTVIDSIRAAGIDWLFIIGWSQIARKAVLDAARLGALGIHPTLLPEGRGRAPIPWAILKGLERTGVTIFRLDEGVDTGDILDQIELPLAHDETATTLYERVSRAHEELIARVWPALLDGKCTFRRQDENAASVWPRRKPEDGALLSTMTCEEADRLVRATTRPYPGAFYDRDGTRYRIWAGKALTGMAASQLTPGPLFFVPLRDGAFAAEVWEIEERRAAAAG